MKVVLSFILTLAPFVVLAEESQTNNPKETKIEKSEKVEEPAKEPVEGTIQKKNSEEMKSQVPEYLNGVMLRLGFSKVGVTVGDVNYRASGATDIELLYPVQKFPLFNVLATYRYLPVSVAPTIEKHEYVGVISSHLFGSSIVYPYNNIHFWSSAELGFVLSSLSVSQHFTKPTRISDGPFGFAMSLGGGAEYKINQSLAMGLKTNINLLTAFQWQVGFVTSLSF